MDILIHTFSGIAVASTIAHLVPAEEKRSLSIIGIGALGGALPDFDAISLWSKFDDTIGTWLQLADNGRNIYFNTFPYSHHGAMHSLVFPLLLVTLVWLFSALVSRVRGRSVSTLSSKWKRNKWHIITFVAAYFLHVLEDLPTPGSVWGGVNLWWPTDTWVGGYGYIWWWNNYDLFLIICGIIALNVMLLVIRKMSKRSLSKMALVVFFAGISLGVKQIATRGYDFDYEGFSTDYSTMEQKSKDVQREILGETVYFWMEEFDNHVPLNF